jgi:hypothetical protein
MEARAIRSLRPNVSRDEAIRTFTASGPAFLYWKLRSGSLQRIADAYVPFRIYLVNFSVRGVQRTHHFALDAVDGSFDLFEFAAPLGCRTDFRVHAKSSGTRASRGSLREVLRDKSAPDLQQDLKSGNQAARRTASRRNSPALLARFLWHAGEPAMPCAGCGSPPYEGARASALFEQWLAA